MAISENRIAMEKIIEENKSGTTSSGNPSDNSGTGNTAPTLTKSSSDKEPGGLIARMPSSVTQFSSFRELSQFAAGKINDFKADINTALKIPNIDDLIKMTSGLDNVNGLIVNKALGVFKSVMCGDGRGIDFGLDKILMALDFRFEFLRDYNVCGRQQLRNPIDVLLKTEKQFVDFANGLKNIDKKLLKNFLAASDKFVTTNKLPIDLKNCSSYKALQNFANDLRDGMSTGNFKHLQNIFNNKICSSSEKGIASTPKVVTKAVATPYVTNMTKFDRDSMYSSMTSILNNSGMERDILLDITCGNALKKENSKNTIKTLELIAYTKVVGPLNQPKQPDGNITGTNDYLQNNSNSSDKILDNIINAHEQQKNLSTSEAIDLGLTNKESTDMLLVGQLDAKDVICNMKDKTDDSQDPIKDFNNLMSLLEIADEKFKPNKAIDVLNLSKSIKDLAVNGSKSHEKQFTTNIIQVDNVSVYEVDSTLNTMDYVNILSNVSTTDDLLICECAC